MKERPILFQGAMVRALLADLKTQTRRVVKPQPAADCDRVLLDYALDSRSGKRVGVAAWFFDSDGWHDGGDLCPYGQPGDRLWVRESWMPDPPDDGTWGYTAWAGERIGQIASVPDRFRHPAFCNYAASWLHGPVRWTPGIHMPRWASRITLEVTGVRVERLQDISEADAIAEGIHKPVGSQFWHSNDLAHLWDGGGGLPGDTPQRAYRSLWNSINLPPSPVQERIAGKLVTVAYVSYPWSMEDFEQAYHGVAASGLYRGKPLTITSNPWLWVVEFRRNT